MSILLRGCVIVETRSMQKILTLIYEKKTTRVTHRASQMIVVNAHLNKTLYNVKCIQGFNNKQKQFIFKCNERIRVVSLDGNNQFFSIYHCLIRCLFSVVLNNKKVLE